MKYAIVIPAYKAANTIAETLHSIAACQPEIHQAVAVLLVDDCSPDNQVEIARAAWRKDLPPLVIFQSETNQGQWKSLNIGIEQAVLAGAEWFFVLHADDLAKPEWLAEILRIISNEAQIASVCSSYDLLFSDGHITTGENKLNRTVEVISATPNRVRDTLLIGCWWHISGCAIKVEAYKEVGDFNKTYSALADWDWVLRVFETNKWGIAYIPRTLIYYRQHAGAITAQTIRTTARVEEQVEIVNRFTSYLTRMDHVRWHGQQLYFTARRLLRDVLTRNPNGLKTDGRTAMVLVRSAVRHIVRRRV